jgi:hypothetical protein
MVVTLRIRMSIPDNSSTHIGFYIEGIIDPVDHIGQGNYRCQLDNFIFRIIFADVIQDICIDGGCTPGNNIREADGGFFFGIENVTVLVKFKRPDLFFGNTGLLRRSSMVIGSVAAGVDAGCFQICQLFVSGFNFAFAHDRIVKLNECLQGFRKSGDDSENIGNHADVGLDGII